MIAGALLGDGGTTCSDFDGTKIDETDVESYRYHEIVPFSYYSRESTLISYWQRGRG